MNNTEPQSLLVLECNKNITLSLDTVIPTPLNFENKNDITINGNKHIVWVQESELKNCAGVSIKNSHNIILKNIRHSHTKQECDKMY